MSIFFVTGAHSVVPVSLKIRYSLLFHF